MELTKEELKFVSSVLSNSQVTVAQAKPVVALLDKINTMLEEEEPKAGEVKEEEVKEEPKEEEKPVVLD